MEERQNTYHLIGCWPNFFFQMDTIAFLLFLDVIRWFSLDGLVLTRVADILTEVCSN